jgi:hypothetical protein
MRRQTTELVRVGNYAVDVAIELIVDEDDWSPSFSSDDALKLDAVRTALKSGNLAEAAKYGHVFELLQIS